MTNSEMPIPKKPSFPNSIRFLSPYKLSGLMGSNVLAIHRLDGLDWGGCGCALAARRIRGVAAEFAHTLTHGAKDFRQLANTKEHDDDNHDQT